MTAKIIAFPLARAVERAPLRRLFDQKDGKIVLANGSAPATKEVLERVTARTSRPNRRLIELLRST